VAGVIRDFVLGANASAANDLVEIHAVDALAVEENLPRGDFAVFGFAQTRDLRSECRPVPETREGLPRGGVTIVDIERWCSYRE
jgi:hypothetical protein